MPQQTHTTFRHLTSWLAALVFTLGVSPALALHEESPPATRLTGGTPHAHPRGQHWGNFFAFVSDRDLANTGNTKPQVFLFNMAFYDCAQGTTKTCGPDGAPGCQNTECPAPGTPWIVQVTHDDGRGAPANPSAGDYDEAGNQWVAFDAVGAGSRRQIFMKNTVTGELRQVTSAGDGDSTHPSVNIIAGTVVFESTASLGGFPNPARVKQVYVFHRPSGLLTRITNGAAPSEHATVNHNGTGIAFQSRAALLGSGADTGVTQVWWAQYDKNTRRATLHRITKGSAPSTNPVVDGRPGVVGGRHIAFESRAIDLPNSTGTPGSQIYRVPLDDTGRPGAIEQLTRGDVHGDCHFPAIDQTGKHYAVVCSGDPLRNGTTGPRLFVLEPHTSTVFQITGIGEVQGPVGHSLGQWFLTVATTGDLTGHGSCGPQLYVIDYWPLGMRGQPGWMAATLPGQLPQDALDLLGTGSSAPGLRTFDVRGGASTVSLASRADTLVSTVGERAGRLGLRIGAIDERSRVAPIDVPAARVSLPPIPAKPFGAFCLEPLADGYGMLACEGGVPGGDLSMSQDHLSVDDAVCLFGCREDEYAGARDACTGLGLPGPNRTACAVCIDGVCDGGLIDGAACVTDAACQVGMGCVDGSTSACNGRLLTLETGVYQPGGAVLALPVRVRRSLAPGADGRWCDDGDIYAALPPVDATLRLTTGALEARIDDADAEPGAAFARAAHGAPFSCERVRAGDLAGATLVGMLPLLNVPGEHGLDDVVLELALDADGGPRLGCQLACASAADCPTRNPCVAARCDEIEGCVFEPLGGACDDGNACTTGDVCDAGACRGQAVTCVDDDLCDGIATCNPTTGTCEEGPPPSCNDGNVCTDDACDPTRGCVYTPVSRGCDDGSACTTGDTCVGGHCLGTPTAAALACAAGNGSVCDGSEQCNPATGACIETAPLDCDDGNPCTADSCSPAAGCRHVPRSGPCDDGNACTTGDACRSGACTGTRITCATGDACTLSPTCDPETGCVEGLPRECDDRNACTTDTCDPSHGCRFTAHVGSCDDGDACTAGDTCRTGVCTGTPVACEPQEPTCTGDDCPPPATCVDGAPCDDGNACSTGDTCRAGTCSGAPVSCNDGNPCNGVETCDPARGCVAGDAPVCDDADPCTADRCDYGVGCRATPVPDLAACRARRLVQFLTDTPAADVGGVRRHQRLLRRATAAARRLERAAMVPAPRAERLRRKAKHDLFTLSRLGRKGLQRGEIVPTLANQMLALVGQAARAASGR